MNPFRSGLASIRVGLTLPLFVVLFLVVRSQAALQITEFMAGNDSTLRDDFGAFSDWIEIYNNGTEAANLDGYFLTDNLTQLNKWRFPATNLPPNRFLIVFASDLDRRLPGTPLHTNFKLSAEGESLALVSPDGKTVLTQYIFDAQASGFSFGLEMETTNAVELLPSGAAARTFIPTLDIGSGWVNPSFNDSSWLLSATAIGFETTVPTTASLKDFIGTDIRSQMSANMRPVAYLRIPFTLDNPTALGDVRLSMRYDDGFVAYLNGTEVGRRNAPATLKFNSVATNVHPNTLAITFEEILSGTPPVLLLRPGTNVLAIQGLNRSTSDSDFLISPQLTAAGILVHPEIQRVFAQPTPGLANTGGLPGTAGEVTFSRESGGFTEKFDLHLSPPAPTSTGVIRYTLDRTVPTATSLVYSVSISVTNTTQVRARLFEPGMFPGRVKTGSYVALSTNVTNFSSDLPVMILHTLGGGTIGDMKETVCHLEIHDTFRGRSSLTRPNDLVTRATAKQRGSSTGGNTKKAMAIEFWDEANDARNLSPLGMPAESDWILYAVDDQEPVLIHNPYAYDLGNRMGRYAPRARFIELYLNESGGPVTAVNYFGIYVLVEKIKIGPNRVDLDPLRLSDTAPPDVTGGYLFKFDRRDPAATTGGVADSGFAVLGLSAGEGALGPCYVDPKESEIKLPERDPQEKYLAKFFKDFDAAVVSPIFADPDTGYAKYLDVDAAIDFHLLNTLTFTVDGNVLSTFFYKPRNGKVTFGPPWDFDRSMGSLDAGFSRDQSPLVWASQSYFFYLSWWERLFNDSNFWQRYIDRYQALRRDLFSTAQLVQRVDYFVDMVREAQVREVARWPNFTKPRNLLLTAAGGYTFDFRNAGYQGEVDQMKHWLTERVRFMDGNFVDPPTFSSPGGQIIPGFSLTISGPSTATLYYTLDGTDPRLPGGAINPKALVYSGPITLNSNARVFARSFNRNWKSITGGLNPPLSSPWSGYLAETFFVQTPTLVVTEVMYHPAAPTSEGPYAIDDFEYLELKNNGVAPLALKGFQISGAEVLPKGSRNSHGIQFTFPDMILSPGQYVLVVRNRMAFESRYGTSRNIAGEFTGRLGDNGDRVTLAGPLLEPILDFEYSDAWFPITDGYGFSIVTRDENSSLENWTTKSNWRSSSVAGGSPGTAEIDPPSLPAIVVNEVVAHTLIPTKDIIELYNPGNVQADIGGWFLTDDPGTPRKFTIPTGKKIEAGGYVLFTEDDFNSTPRLDASFALSSHGDQVYLFSADAAGNLTGYRDGFSFGGSENGVSLSRHLRNPVLLPNDVDYPASSVNTFGGPNAAPKIGPVVISEIMYHPPDVLANGAYWDDPQAEFIELRNLTDQPVNLFDPLYPTNTWQIQSSKDFIFPTNIVLAPKASLVVVNFDPALLSAELAAFKARRSIGPETPIIGPFAGKLDNSSENLRLVRPGTPAETDLNEVPYVVVDQVHYTDSAPWPVGPNGIGLSLQRVHLDQYGNDPENWTAALPTVGHPNVQPGTPPEISEQPESLAVVGGLDATFSVKASGSGSLRYQWFFNNKVLNGKTEATLFLTNVTLSDAGEYSAAVYSDNSVAISATARLTVRQPARILVPPVRQTVNGGTNVTFRVAAQGQGSLRYQWQFKNAPILGATNAVLTLSNVALRATGEYRVEVGDDVGAALSTPALLTVLVKPVITLQPQPMIAAAGASITFTFAAYGTPPLSYVWMKNNDVLGSSVTNSGPSILATLTIPHAQPGDAALYRVKYGSPALAQGFSVYARLTVMTDSDGDGMPDDWELAHQLRQDSPADGLHDDDQDGLTNLEEYWADTDPHSAMSRLELKSISIINGRAQLSFDASSNLTYSVQFRPQTAEGEWIALTNTPVFSGTREVVVTDLYPATEARWYRLVTPQQPRMETGPLILESPHSISVTVGDEVVFAVVAAGRGQLTYQWLMNGFPILGETGSSLRLPEAQIVHQGNYSVLVTDELGSSSSSAELVVVPR